MLIKSIGRIDKKTKNLVNRLKVNEIAIINHEDIDEIAAKSLVECKPSLIINAAKSISGRYRNLGPQVISEAGIPILDNVGKDAFDKINEKDMIEVRDGKIYIEEELIGEGQILNEEIIHEKLDETSKNFEKELHKFIENTLEYASKEKQLFLDELEIPPVKTKFENRHTLVVVRGQNYKEDLKAIRTYIDEFNPILIGVDGGGDALMEFGYIPDIIVGDMDSISDDCLRRCKERVVHAYPDGRAPGLRRMNELNLESIVFPAPGTSEDLAMLLAYHYKTELIVAVGTHSHMVDFLEKGRKGMSSTFLVRLKVGSKLIDAKGVSKLYRESIKLKHLIGITVGAIIPIFIIGAFSSPGQQLLKLLIMKLKFAFPV